MNEQNPACESGASKAHGFGQFGISGAAMMGDCAMRQTARDVIRDRMGQLRTEAARLEALLDALPARLQPDAEQALFDLAIAARR